MRPDLRDTLLQSTCEERRRTQFNHESGANTETARFVVSRFSGVGTVALVPMRRGLQTRAVCQKHNSTPLATGDWINQAPDMDCTSCAQTRSRSHTRRRVCVCTNVVALGLALSDLRAVACHFQVHFLE